MLELCWLLTFSPLHHAGRANGTAANTGLVQDAKAEKSGGRVKGWTGALQIGTGTLGAREDRDPAGAARRR